MDWKRTLTLFLLVFGLGAAMPRWAQAQVEVGLKMDVDQRQLEVGDTLTLTLEFKQLGSSNSSVVQEPSIPSSEFFEIRGTSSATQVSIINRQMAQVSRTTIKLEATKAGTATLGPALLIYQDPSGKRHEIQSNIVTVTVTEKSGFSLFGKKKTAAPTAVPQAAAPAQPTPDELNGIKGLPPDSFSWVSFAFWSVVLAVIIGYFWRRRNKNKKGPAKFISVGKIAELQQAWKKLGREDISSKEFALELSNLVRECLQYRFGFPAVDLTTEEIFTEVKKFKLSEAEKVAVEKCLKTSDRVLYADGSLVNKDALKTTCSALLPKNEKN